MNNEILLEIQELEKYFPMTSGLLSKHVGDVKAVDGVTLTIKSGEVMGLVGESGCGKSTLGRAILRLEEPTGGRLVYKGTDITRINSRGLRELRKEMQIIFQDPDASLDPRMTVGDSIGEALVIHNIGDDSSRLQRIAELMKQVGLEPAQADSYPHEFSGGQKQRIGIARAMAVNPGFIVADEPVSALDVSIQAQILNLMMDIQESLGLTYLFISHDLSVIKYVANRIAVMYLGKIVETASKNELFKYPLHPYTQALLSAVPTLKAKNKERIMLLGDVPSLLEPPKGCHFHPRCHKVMPVCRLTEPLLREVSSRHNVSCHLYGKI
jgi:oligopeptide/dipeptide ABC transporter ATP-binding protein